MKRSRNSTGFTMLEVAMAVLALGLGFLALYHLIGHGLGSAIKSSSETRTAEFAEMVLNTLHAESDARAETNAVAWTNLWNGDLCFDGDHPDRYGLPVACPDAWTAKLRIYEGTHSVSFVIRGASTDIPSHSLRYAINITPPDESLHHAEVVLKIWEGATGSYADTNASFFYSEFARTGNL